MRLSNGAKNKIFTDLQALPKCTRLYMSKYFKDKIFAGNPQNHDISENPPLEIYRLYSIAYHVVVKQHDVTLHQSMVTCYLTISLAKLIVLTHSISLLVYSAAITMLGIAMLGNCVVLWTTPQTGNCMSQQYRT